MTAQLQRPLSPLERWYWIADQVSPLNVVARVCLHGTIASGLLEAATAALVSEYPMLRVAIAADTDGTNPTFVPSSRPTDIRTLTGDDVEWQRQIDHTELATPLNWQSGPLARLVQVSVDVQTHDLVLTISHVIADGTTALYLLRRLIEHANQIAQSSQASDLITSRSVIPAADDLLPARYRGVRALPRVAATAVADRLATAVTRPHRLSAESAVPAQRRRTRLLCRRLSRGELNALAQRCRAEGVSVHGALLAAMATAIGPTAAQLSSGRLAIGSPIDVRAELTPPVPADEAGAYVVTVPSAIRFGGGRDLWSIARHANRSLARRTRTGQHLTLMSAGRYVSPKSLDTCSRVFGLLERSGPGNICLSNIGRYDFPTRIGDWSLSGAQFIAGISVSGYFVATANTSHDELHWNFTYIEDVVSQRAAEQFADNAVTTLLDAIGAGRKEGRETTVR